MPIYDFKSECGVRFEALINWSAPNPACPHCGAQTSRLPGLGMVSGAVIPPAGDEGAPRSWEGVHRGDRDYITGWRRRLERRRSFEERHPEHSTRRDAVAAHEGTFERAPLTYKELATRAETTGTVAQARADAAASRTAESAR